MTIKSAAARFSGTTGFETDKIYFRVLAPQVVVLSTANDLVKLQNVVSHADQCPLPAYFLQSA